MTPEESDMLKGYLSQIEDLEELSESAFEVVIENVRSGVLTDPATPPDFDSQMKEVLRLIKMNNDHLTAYLNGMPTAVAVHELAGLLAFIMKRWLNVDSKLENQGE